MSNDEKEEEERAGQEEDDNPIDECLSQTPLTLRLLTTKDRFTTSSPFYFYFLSTSPPSYSSFLPSKLTFLLSFFFFREENNNLKPSSTKLHGCVLISDVSGFTRLSTVLNVEELRFHMK